MVIKVKIVKKIKKVEKVKNFKKETFRRSKSNDCLGSFDTGVIENLLVKNVYYD